MAQFVNIYPCDLQKGPVQTSLHQIYLGDVDANRIGVKVTNGGEDFPLSGTCSGTAILCNGGTVALTGVISGNTAYVDLPSGVYSVEGPLEVYVAVTTSGITTTLLHAHGNAVRTDTGTVIDPGTIIPSVAALISDIEDAVDSIPADYSTLLGSLAPTFSSSTAYAAGTYVWYDGDLYKFTSDHAAGSWSGSDATAAVFGTEVADLKGAMSGKQDTLTFDNTPTENSTNPVKSGGVYTALSGKVNKPGTNGTSGQFLKTNGDGTTAWADPLTEPIDDAVADWLDAHPEATTTVEDNSLTYAKLVKGTLGYVIPQQFGAVGDGVTDDTTAIKNCIDYAIDNNYTVFLPEGTYIVNSATLAFAIGNGKSLVICGCGQNSVIKRKADSLDGKWSRLFSVTVMGGMITHGKDVIFSNFFIDSNRRGQSMATSGDDYEASADIAISNGTGEQGGTDQYIDKVLIDNMTFFDPVADCFNFSGSGQVYVNHVYINNMIATGRQGTRSDIGFTGNPLMDVHITNCSCGSIHFEYNSTVSDDAIIPYLIENCVFNNCSLGGRFDLLLSNTVINYKFLVNGFHKVIVSNCKIKNKNGTYITFSENGECYFSNSFSKCKRGIGKT